MQLKATAFLIFLLACSCYAWGSLETSVDDFDHIVPTTKYAPIRPFFKRMMTIEFPLTVVSDETVDGVTTTIYQFECDDNAKVYGDLNGDIKNMTFVAVYFFDGAGGLVEYNTLDYTIVTDDNASIRVTAKGEIYIPQENVDQVFDDFFNGLPVSGTSYYSSYPASFRTEDSRYDPLNTLSAVHRETLIENGIITMELFTITQVVKLVA